MQPIQIAKQFFLDALAAQQKNDFASAEILLKRALEIVPDRVSVRTNLAAALLKLGKVEEALTHAEQSVKLDPTNAEGWANTGNANSALNRHQQALDCYERALTHNPAFAEVWMNRGNVQATLGQMDVALASYDRALELNPRSAEAYCNRGSLLAKMKQQSASLDSYRRALELDQNNADVHYNLGNALIGMRQFGAALKSFDRAIEIKPQFADAHAGRGNALRELRQSAAAVQSYDLALSLNPDNAEVLSNRGNALLDLGQHAAALQSYDRAIELNPDLAETHSNRGNVLLDMKRHYEALDSYSRAISCNQDFAEGYSNRGNLFRCIGERNKSLADFETAIALDPASAAHHLKHLISQIPVIANDETEWIQSRDVLERELESLNAWISANETHDAQEAVGSAQPFYLAYQEENNRHLLQHYGSICTTLMSRWREQADLPSPLVSQHARSQKTRLGIASAHINDHSVWNAFVKGWVEQLDKSKYEIHLYQLFDREDDETRFAREHATSLESGNKTLSNWVELIENDRNHMLIYPDLGMDPMAIRLASLRLAPVQAAAWGHPETTGLPTMDYYLSAKDFETSSSQDCYSERLVTLPNLGCYYSNPHAPETNIDLATLGLSTARPLFVCPGTPYKYAPQHDEVFVEIAKRVPNAQFLFFEHNNCPPLSHKLFQRLTAVFARNNLHLPDHGVLAPWQTRSEFHSILKQADVYLDTLGFSGFNTAMHAVECGLPIVTLEGRFMRGRLASAILKRMQISELVTSNKSAYVELATRLAQNKSYNAKIRTQMRHAQNVLYNDTAVICALEKFLDEARLSNPPLTRSAPPASA